MSGYLAQWIEQELGLKFVLRIKAGAEVKYKDCWYSAGELASKGQTLYPHYRGSFIQAGEWANLDGQR